jgi:membrane associated rhomboid family serine protease
MRYTVVNQGGGFGAWRGGFFPPAIKALLWANGIVFLLQMLVNAPIIHYFGLTPAMVMQGAVWQLFTYMFLHGGFFHILFNMLALWMFGRDIEDVWGTKDFMKFYLICGIGAGIVTTLILWKSPIPTIGASGAIFGVLLAFGMLWPNRVIYLWFFVPVKAKYMVIMFGLLELVASFRFTSDGVGHFTHLGGLAVGYLYLKMGDRPLRFPQPFAFMGVWRGKQKARRLKRRWEDERALMEAVDRVLDRINEVGYEQLTDEEKEILERAAQRLSTENSKK